MTDETPTVAASSRPDAQAPGNAVAILLSVLALIASIAVVLWMWQIGDLP